MKILAKNTVTVTRLIATCFDLPESEEKRAGTWGFTIGNLWAPTRKELHAQALDLLECGMGREDWKTILLSAEWYPGQNMFSL